MLTQTKLLRHLCASQEEIIAASSDAISLQLGHRNKASHPDADLVAGWSGIQQSAMACGYKRMPRLDPNVSKSTLLDHGLRSIEFSHALAAGSYGSMVAAFDGAAAHREFCEPLEVKDFKSYDAPGYAFKSGLQLVGEGAEVRSSLVTSSAGAEDLILQTYSANLILSRRDLFDDRVGAFQGLIQSYGAAAARIEALLVVQALEGNQDLDDGQPIFDSTFANVVDVAAFGAEGLESAMTAMRKLPMANGQTADFTLRHLAVPAESEWTARKLVHELGFNISVTVLSDLPANRWYGFADKKIRPVVHYLKLKGAPSPVSTRRMETPIQIDGTAFRATADLGAVVTSRLGVVRGGV